SGSASHLIRVREPEGLVIYCLDGEEPETVFSESEKIYTLEGKKLVFENAGDRAITLIVAERGINTRLAPGEKTESSGEKISSFTLLSGEKSTFVTDEKSLRAALGSDADNVVVCRDVSLEERLDFSRLCRIDLLSNAIDGELRLSTNERGDLALIAQKPGSIFLSADAPRVNVLTSGSPLANAECAGFYLKAAALDGNPLDGSLYPVNSFSMLRSLAEGEGIRFAEEDTIVFIKSFALESDLDFKGVYSLDFKAVPSFENRVLRFESAGAHRITVNTTAELDTSFIVIDSPETELVWTGRMPELEKLSETIEVRTLNNESMDPYRLGGETEAVLKSFSVHGEDLSHPIEFSENGRLLCGEMDNIDALSLLKDATVIYEVENGSLLINGERIASGEKADLSVRSVVTLTDESGASKKMLLKIERKSGLLPIIEINTDNGVQITSKTEYVNATISIDAGTSGFESLRTTRVQIRGRGNSTWKWEKKPFKLKFSEDVSLFGLAESNEWALLSNYADKSLLRNALAYEMARCLSFEFTPSQFPVDVYLNGEYQGVYTIGEHLEAAPGRVETEYSPDPEKTDYLLEVGGVDSTKNTKGVDYFHADTIKHILIKSPADEKITKNHFDDLSSYFIKADKAVSSEKNWRDFVDEESLIDWLIMMELTNNTDGAFRRSCFFTKNAGEKLKLGPVWDFDLAFGNFNRDKANYDQWATTTDDDYVGVTWTAHLLQDKEFVEAFKKRWDEVRDRLLETANAYLDKYEPLVTPSAEENFRLWGNLNIRTTMQRSDVTKYNTYPKQIQYIRDFLTDRAEWLDGELERLYSGGVYEIPVIEKDEEK
ncbi:MAG: CotH kinase family protein, partial [Clostridia bacterium]|nr:CotH kinase family protein [Clostridia bacterium]